MRKIGQIFRFLIPVIALVALVVFMTGAGSRERAKLEENKAIVRASVEKFWNTGDLAGADEIYATNYVGHHPGALGEVRGREAMKKWAKVEFAAFPAFPNAQITIEDLVAEGDKVTERWTLRETIALPWHDGVTLRHIGNVMQTGITIYRIADGKIVEGWWNYDALGKMQALGFKLVPAEE